MPGAGFSESAYVSHYNNPMASTASGLSSTKIHDTTLRDGEQQAGVVFTKDEKVRIARLLSACGVHRIETAIPAVSKDDQEATAEIASLDLPSETWVAIRALNKDVDLASSLGVDGAGVICMANDQYLDVFGWTLDGILGQVSDAVIRAKGLGLAATVLIVDSTRMERDRLATVMQTIQERTDLDGFSFMDTYGALSPEGVSALVKYGRELTDLPIEVHTHNDFGLATINALMASRAGAEVVHTSVHGLGERVGNAPLEEFAVASKVLYGADLGIDLAKLRALSEAVEEASRAVVAANKPIVGAFNRIESGFVVAEYLHIVRDGGHPSQWLLPFAPELVGAPPVEIVLGKGSGLANINFHLESLGLDLSDDDRRALLDIVKARSIEAHRDISPDEFALMAKELDSERSR